MAFSNKSAMYSALFLIDSTKSVKVFLISPENSFEIAF